MSDEYDGWRKSSRSNSGACVEAGLQGARWRTSSRCDAGACVEAGQGQGTVAVRDTLDRSGPVLTFGIRAWTAFTGRVKREEAAMGGDD